MVFEEHAQWSANLEAKLTKDAKAEAAKTQMSYALCAVRDKCYDGNSNMASQRDTKDDIAEVILGERHGTIDLAGTHLAVRLMNALGHSHRAKLLGVTSRACQVT